MRQYCETLSTALKTDNAEKTKQALQALTNITIASAGNDIFTALNKPRTPETYYVSECGVYSSTETNINCFTKLFSIAKLGSAKTNISFLKYLFETLLNKLDEADHHLKNQIVTIFKESTNNYACALEFYISQLDPEQLKSLLKSDKLLTRIIDIKPFFSSESDFRQSINELQAFHEIGFYAARDRLCHQLKTEINRLRDKRKLNDTDIELSNSLVRIRKDLKKFLPTRELEIALNIEIGQVEKIQFQKNIDAESAALLTQIKMIKSWYLTEYQKIEKTFFDELLSFISAPTITTTSVEKVISAEAMKLPSAAMASTVAPQQQKTTTTPRFFSTPTIDIAAVAALSVPTLNPAVATLKVRRDPISVAGVNSCTIPRFSNKRIII